MTRNKEVLAWLAMVSALALHVVDEALNDFLAFYNPMVQRLREGLGFFPMPTFEYEYWIGGLIAAVAIGYLATLLVAKGVRGIKTVMVVIGALMVLNGVIHLIASVYFGTLIPGTLSSPLLLAASLCLVFQGLKSRRPT